MNDMITIENTEMQIREYAGQRVVTFKDIDTVHGNKSGTAKRNFIRNKKHFIDGEDYVLLTSEAFKSDNLSLLNIDIPTRGITVLTESGYLLIAKSFTDDLSWQVQRALVNSYFKQGKEIEKRNLPEKAYSKNTNTWYQKEKWKIDRLCFEFGWERSYAYHLVLTQISLVYNYEWFKERYYNKYKKEAKYDMDVVNEYVELQKMATGYIDFLLSNIGPGEE